jgi:hypothetical protein
MPLGQALTAAASSVVADEYKLSRWQFRLGQETSVHVTMLGPFTFYATARIDWDAQWQLAAGLAALVDLGGGSSPRSLPARPDDLAARAAPVAAAPIVRVEVVPPPKPPAPKPTPPPKPAVLVATTQSLAPRVRPVEQLDSWSHEKDSGCGEPPGWNDPGWEYLHRCHEVARAIIAGKADRSLVGDRFH